MAASNREMSCLLLLWLLLLLELGEDTSCFVGSLALLKKRPQAKEELWAKFLLDINRWLLCFTVKLVSKIMRASWVYVMHPGLILLMLLLVEASCLVASLVFSNVTA
jgi:hypothetical protein